MEPRTDLIRTAITIMKHVQTHGPKWKIGSAEKHLVKRIDRGHVANDFTLHDYNDLIIGLVTGEDHEVYLYYKTVFNQDYYVFGDGTWIVIIGEDGIIETSFPPNHYRVYLSPDEGYAFLGTIEELKSENGC